MPGSATLNPDVLIDDILTTVDDLRSELHAEFGLRQFRLFTVERVWDSGYVGDGLYSDVETEITPAPRVVPFTRSGDSVSYELRACGLDEAGFVAIQEVSLTYTEEELTGGTLAQGTEWLFRLRDGQGQGIPDRDFVLDGVPFPDREKTLGWSFRLRRA